MHRIRAVKDKTARYFMLGVAIFGILFLLLIGLSLFFKALPIMKEKNLWVLLSSANWKPFKGDFGFLPFILSTLYVSVIAIIIALPLSLLTSIFLSSYASKNV
ncbi:MAG: phosphate ABC transporter permease subunit PstC, partial [Bacteroidetes bacterium]